MSLIHLLISVHSSAILTLVHINGSSFNKERNKHNISQLALPTNTVVQRCSVEKVFLEIYLKRDSGTGVFL